MNFSQRSFSSLFPLRQVLILPTLLALLFLTGGCGGEKPAPPKNSSTATQAGTSTPSQKTPADTAKETSAGNLIPATGGDTVRQQLAAFQNAAPVGGNPGTRYSLKLRPKSGHRYSYRVVQRSVTEMEGLKMDEESAYNFTAKVTGLNTDGSFTLEMHYDSIRVRRDIPAGVIDSNAQTIMFDTRQKADPKLPGSQQFKALIGQNVNMTISATGEIREISNIDPIISAMLGKQRDSLPPSAISQLRESIKIQAFMSIIQQLFLQAQPDGDVAVGQQWTRADSVPLIGIPSKMSIGCKLSEVRQINGQPVGNIVMNLTTDFLRKKIDNATVKATVNKADVHGQGVLLLDLTTGFPITKSTHINMTLDLTGEAKTGPSKGKSKNISQRMSTGTTVELLSQQ